MTAWLALMWGLNRPIPEAKSSTILTIAVRRTWERSDETSRVTSPMPGGGGEWLINSILLEHAVLLQSDLLD